MGKNEILPNNKNEKKEKNIRETMKLKTQKARKNQEDKIVRS